MSEYSFEQLVDMFLGIVDCGSKKLDHVQEFEEDEKAEDADRLSRVLLNNRSIADHSYNPLSVKEFQHDLYRRAEFRSLQANTGWV